MTIDMSWIYLWDDSKVPITVHWKLRALCCLCVDHGHSIVRRAGKYDYIFTGDCWQCVY